MTVFVKMFLTFLKLGVIMFGGGYGLLSMLMTEAESLGITLSQFADLTALDLIIPGPIAVNAATYIGYLNSGFLGALGATVGVAVPSYVICIAVLYWLDRFRESRLMQGVLSGVKPAAVSLIVMAVVTIGGEVLLREGQEASALLTNPFGALSPLAVAIFAAAALLHIRFKINPIFLTVCAGVIGAFWL